ncbi:D-alanyl-D-alanine carboxypeptidase [Kitasatospora sp. NPDC002551]|uniref:D-alanyl-D-alanine carboxypeptidase family protein n=1 Tax=Kitasatospora sp. NPDC002551 TaxID=3154539 RepID=UPI00331DA351
MQQRSPHVSTRARAGRPAAAGAVAALVLAAGSPAALSAPLPATPPTARPTTPPSATTAAPPASPAPTVAPASPTPPASPTSPASPPAVPVSAAPAATGAPAALAPGSAQDATAVVGGERLGRPTVQVAPRAGAPELPAGLTGRSWLVADAATGAVLAARDAHLPLPPASTLKMLFADTVLPKFDRSLEHRVTPAELAGVGAGSSLVGIKENLPYRVEDLWRGVFLASGNDAVHVLSHMNGGLAHTVAQMQERALALQARDTRVVSPDGYDQPGQVSSAYDLTLFARAGLRNPDFRSYCATRTARFPGGLDLTTGQRTAFDIANTDRLLGKYPGLIGVKNGYTTNAGATFTGAAERGGRTLLVTVMHPEQQSKVYDEAAALLDWGFAALGKVEPVGTLVEEAGASAPATATGAPASEVPPSDVPASEVLPDAIRQADHTLGPAGWTATALCAALALWAAARLRVRRRLLARTAAAAPPTALPATPAVPPRPNYAPYTTPYTTSHTAQYAATTPHPPTATASPSTATATAPRGATAVGGSTAVGGGSRRRLARRARGLARTARTRLTSPGPRRPR